MLRIIRFIAQLLGRMIRTPLARRIEADVDLNCVSLYLPYFDEETVASVVLALQESEAAIPAETGSSNELVTLVKNSAFTDVFDGMDNLVTYRVETVRRVPALRTLDRLV